MEKSEFLKGIENNYVMFLAETINFVQVEKPAAQNAFAEAKFLNNVTAFKKAASDDLENDFCAFTAEISSNHEYYRGILTLEKGEEIISTVLKRAEAEMKDPQAFLDAYKFFFMSHALMEIGKYCKNKEGFSIVKGIVDGLAAMQSKDSDVETMAIFYGFAKNNLERFLGFQQFKQEDYVYENVDKMKALIEEQEQKFGFTAVIPDLRVMKEAKPPKANKKAKDGEKKKKGLFGFGK